VRVCKTNQEPTNQPINQSRDVNDLQEEICRGRLQTAWLTERKYGMDGAKIIMLSTLLSRQEKWQRVEASEPYTLHPEYRMVEE